MTVQSVNLMSFATANTKSTATTNRECGFESFLASSEKIGQTANDTKQTSSAAKNNAATNKQQSVDEISYDDANTKQNMNVQEKQSISTEAADCGTMDSLSEGGETIDNSQETALLPEDVLAKILSVLNEIVTAFQATVQIDEQQLLDATEALQFNVTDFFDPEKIKELYLQVQGMEPTELLTNESLYQTVEQLQTELLNLLENSGLEQLLIQDGIDPNQFDLSLFSEQIVEYVKTVTVTEDIVQNTEVVIAFEHETVQTDLRQVRNSEADYITTAESLADEVSEGIENDDTGFDQREQQGAFESDNRFEQATMFLQKLVSSAKTTDVEGIQQLNGDFELYDIARQIIDQVKIQIRPDNTRMELQLNPEHLGKVELEITSKNGELSARLNVQNDHVKEAVESQMQVLRETLEIQGLKVENIEVTVAEFGFRFQDESAGTEQQQQRQRRNGQVVFDEAEVEETSFSDVSEVMKEMNGNSVDYVA